PPYTDYYTLSLHTLFRSQVHPDVLLVPQEATTVIQDKIFVFVLDSENKAVRKAITVEGKSGKNYIVSEENLSEGDVIVLTGLDKLTEGSKVNPIPKGQVLANVIEEN